MRIYTALLKPDAEPVLVREGFAWGALLFGPVWLAAHRAWVPAGITLAVLIGITALPAPASVVLLVGCMLILGLTGNDLRRWTLENRGYLLVHVVAASSADDALGRLLGQRSDLVARFRPEPA